MPNLAPNPSWAQTLPKTSCLEENIYRASTVKWSIRLRNLILRLRRERRPSKTPSMRLNQQCSLKSNLPLLATRKNSVSKIWKKPKRAKVGKLSIFMRNITKKAKENGPFSISMLWNWPKTLMMKKMNTAARRIQLSKRWKWMIELKIQSMFALFQNLHGSNFMKLSAMILVFLVNPTSN